MLELLNFSITRPPLGMSVVFKILDVTPREVWLIEEFVVGINVWILLAEVARFFTVVNSRFFTVLMSRFFTAAVVKFVGVGSTGELVVEALTAVVGRIAVSGIGTGRLFWDPLSLIKASHIPKVALQMK